MPQNEKGEINTNSWYTTRIWYISVASAAHSPSEVATFISEWASERRRQGKCFLAGQVHEVHVGRPFGIDRAMQINGEINPEHATYCSNDSARRLLYRLTRLLLEKLSTNRAWIRYNGESMAVTKDWLDQYFVENPSTP